MVATRTKVVDRTIVNVLEQNFENQGRLSTNLVGKAEIGVNDESDWQLLAAFHAFDFKQLVLSVGAHASPEYTRPVLSCICFEFDKGAQTLTLKAADAFRLVKKVLAKEVTEDKTLLLSEKVLAKIVGSSTYGKKTLDTVAIYAVKKTITEADYPTEPLYAEAILIRASGMIDSLTTPVEGNFPRYDLLTNPESKRSALNNFIILDGDQFHADMLLLAQVHTELYGEKDKEGLVGVEIENGIMRLAAVRNKNHWHDESSGIRAYIRTPLVGYSGGTLSMMKSMFNMQFISEALAVLPYPFIRLSWSRGSEMVSLMGSETFRDLAYPDTYQDSFVYVMPVHLPEIYPNRGDVIYPDEDIRPAALIPLADAYNVTNAAYTEAGQAVAQSRTWNAERRDFDDGEQTAALRAILEQKSQEHSLSCIALVKKELELGEPTRYGPNTNEEIAELKTLLERDPSTFTEEANEWYSITKRAEYSRNLKACRFYGNR